MEKTLDEFKDCTWMKYKKIKEDHSHEMREKLKTTMESYRTDKFYNPEFPSVGNILSILYLTEEDADHVKKAEETNREVLENFPDNMSALFVKVQILMFRDEFTEANVCIEKMKAITSSSPMFQSPTEEMKKLKEHECFSRADHAFYLMQLGPKHYTEAVPMLKDAISFFDWQMDDATPCRYSLYLLNALGVYYHTTVRRVHHYLGISNLQDMVIGTKACMIIFLASF